MNLIWSNAKKFNGEGSNIFKDAETIGRIWSRMFAKIKNDPIISRIWGRKTRRSKPKSPKRCMDAIGFKRNGDQSQKLNPVRKHKRKDRDWPTLYDSTGDQLKILKCNLGIGYDLAL